MLHNALQRMMACVVSMLFLALFFPGLALAQGASGVAIAPPSFEITASPGEEFTRQLEVHNTGSEARSFKTTVNNFSATGEEGALAFSPFGDLASWITLSPLEFSLGQDQSKVLDITIKVPPSARPGGHYATVFAIATPVVVGGGTGAAVGQYIGANVLLNITGQVKEAGSIMEFSTAKPSYEQAESIPFRLRVQNAGNTHFRPSGVVEIFKGKTKAASVAINSTQASVLPGSVRKFEVASEKTLPSGKYTAKAAITLGSETLVSEPVSFIVVGTTPLLAVVIVLAIAFVLALIFALRPRKPREVV